jgi:hypothetical protein
MLRIVRAATHTSFRGVCSIGPTVNRLNVVVERDIRNDSAFVSGLPRVFPGEHEVDRRIGTIVFGQEHRYFS